MQVSIVFSSACTMSSLSHLLMSFLLPERQLGGTKQVGLLFLMVSASRYVCLSTQNCIL